MGRVGTYGRLRMDKVKPVVLVTVSELAEIFPVRPHHLFVVVLDERLEDLGLLLVTRVNFGE